MNPAKIGLIVSGSIAAYKAADVASRLVQSGREVRVVLTEAGARFVGAATFEALTGQPVLTDLFAAGEALEHIQFTRWADLVLVCPASADLLNRFAAGLAGDLAGALFLARDPSKPWLIAPAMNPMMWRHPATQAAVFKLAEWGLRFIPVGSGRTACDEYGEGRLAEPDDIVAAVEAAGAKGTRRLRVLVTSGGTSEPLDAVRVLTNTSTGRTGAVIAEHFHRQGHEVTLLRAQTAERGVAAREETFFTYTDLANALQRLLGEAEFDAVIHAAAVGDFGIEAIRVGEMTIEPGGGKLDSGAAPTLILRRHRKLLAELRSLSRNPGVRVVAFKLTSGGAPDLQPLAASADLIVHNDAGERKTPDAFPADLYLPDGRKWAHCATRAELAAGLERFLCHDPVP